MPCCPGLAAGECACVSSTFLIGWVRIRLPDSVFGARAGRQALPCQDPSDGTPARRAKGGGCVRAFFARRWGNRGRAAHRNARRDGKRRRIINSEGRCRRPAGRWLIAPALRAGTAAKQKRVQCGSHQVLDGFMLEVAEAMAPPPAPQRIAQFASTSRSSGRNDAIISSTASRYRGASAVDRLLHVVITRSQPASVSMAERPHERDRHARVLRCVRSATASRASDLRRPYRDDWSCWMPQPHQDYRYLSTLITATWLCGSCAVTSIANPNCPATRSCAITASREPSNRSALSDQRDLVIVMDSFMESSSVKALSSSSGRSRSATAVCRHRCG